MASRITLRRAAAMVAAVGCALLVGATSTALAASHQVVRTRVVYQRQGLVVLRIEAPAATRAIDVAWGDMRTATVTRSCAQHASHSVLLVSHGYANPGVYRVRVSLLHVGCGRQRNASATATISLAARFRSALSRRAAEVPNSADQWVSFNQPYALSDEQYVVGQGSSQDGGCRFPTAPLSIAGTSSPGTAIQQDEVSIDASTCTDIVASGSPPPSDVSPSPVTSSPSSSGASATPTTAPASPPGLPPLAKQKVGKGGPLAHTAAVWESAGYMHSWYQDPVGIVVNDVFDYVQWRWNGGCVTEAVPGGNSATWSWLSGDGWYVEDNGGTYSYQDCTAAETTSYLEFENGIFCAGQAVNDWFWPNYSVGLYNGGLQGYASYGDSGAACVDLLSYHDQLVLTEKQVFIHN
jgi:hypothetical protein